MQVAPRHPLLRALGAAALAGALCAPAHAEPPSATPSADEIAREVQRLEAAVDADRARLLLLVSTPRAPSAIPLHDEPELREIAHRLPELQAELAHWADLTPAPAGGAMPAAPTPPEKARP